MTGATVWLTGLPRAGKSTIAHGVEPLLRACGRRVEVLDGDAVRPHLAAARGYSREDRAINIRRIGWVAELLARNGVVVLVSAIAPFRRPARSRRPTRGGTRPPRVVLGQDRTWARSVVKAGGRSTNVTSVCQLLAFDRAESIGSTALPSPDTVGCGFVAGPNSSANGWCPARMAERMRRACAAVIGTRRCAVPRRARRRAPITR